MVKLYVLNQIITHCTAKKLMLEYVSELQHKNNIYYSAITTQYILNKLIKRTNLEGVCPRCANLHRLKDGAPTSSSTSPSPPASSTDRGSPFLRLIRAKIQGNIN